MEQKKARVSQVQTNVRQYPTQYGQMHVHKITFENGDTGDYSSKNPVQDKFVVGSEVSYSIETKTNGQYTNTIIKPVQEFVPNAPFSKKAQSGSDESFSLSYAKDVTVALIESGKAETDEQTIARAEKFYNWLQSKKK